MFRSAQEAQQTGLTTGYEFHTKPRYLVAVEAVRPLKVTSITREGKVKVSQGRVIDSTVCANWRFTNRSGRVVEAPVCDRISKSLTVPQWSCYTEKKPQGAQAKIQHLLKCVKSPTETACLNRHEVAALTGSGQEAANKALTRLLASGQVHTDQMTKLVLTTTQQRGGQEIKVPPALWTWERKSRVVSPATLRRKRSYRKGAKLASNRGTLACYRI